MFAEDPALYDIPGAADEMPLPQSVLGDPRGPGGRGLDGVPLLATTGNDMSSKESVDKPMQAMTHPLVEKASRPHSLVHVCQSCVGQLYQSLPTEAGRYLKAHSCIRLLHYEKHMVVGHTCMLTLWK